MALDTVAAVAAEVRRVLQDELAPYRYPDPDVLTSLNIGLWDAKRLRPDLFLGADPPQYAALDATAFAVDPQYRSAFVFYVAGRLALRDAEQAQDDRATTMLGAFTGALTGVLSTGG